MSGWPEVTLESLAVEGRYAFTGGPFGSKLTSRDYTDSGVPVIRGSNMNGGRYLCTEEFVYVSDAKVRQDLFANLAHPNDLIFTQRGTLGQVAIVPTEGPSNEYIVSQSQMKMTVDEKKADRAFLYYYLCSRDVVQKILSYVSSSGVPHINLTVMRNFKVPNPPLRIQQEIGDTLSAYDDLIENNRRRMELLEQSARLLFKEWFVHLRFPGHEHTKIVDGVPEGWERKTLGEVLTLQRGFDLPLQAREDGNIPVLGSTGILGWHSQAKVKGPGVVTGRSGSLGIVSYVSTDYWPLNTSLWLKELRGIPLTFAHRLLEHLDLKQYNGGASVPSLDRKVVHRISVSRPSGQLLREFDDQVIMTQQQQILLKKQNEQLAQARDILLPRLMNGDCSI